MTIRVVTTAHKAGLAQYGQDWLDSRKHWPDAEFYWFTEGYDLPYQPDELQMIEQAGAGKTGLIERRELNALPEFAAWKLRHAGYIAPMWKFDVIAYSHKVFAMIEATRDYTGIAVWLDADCVTYRDIPAGLCESFVKDAYIAHYARPGRWSETGFWIVDCAHPSHREFMDFMADVYLRDRYKQLHHWTDCFVLDAAIKRFEGKIKAYNLSGEHEKAGHPMAVTEMGKYIDHRKGPRKEGVRSPENKFRRQYVREQKRAHEAAGL